MPSGYSLYSFCRYTTFGSTIPGRKFQSSSNYRYGFNGKEKSDELTQGDYDFGARIYDSRIGKWMSMDPLYKKYPEVSPYNFGINNPILFYDIDGRDILPSASFMQNKNLYLSYKALLAAPTSNQILSKFASDRTPINAYGKVGELSKYADVVFDTYTGAKGNFGQTHFAFKDGKGNLYDLDNPNDLAAINPKYITKNIKFVATMSFNTNETGDLGITMETVDHEFAVHMDDIIPLLEKLQSGKINGKKFLNEWTKINQTKQVMNGYEQHSEFGKGKEDSFNKITKEQESIIVDKKDKKSFNDEIKKDIKEHGKIYPEIK